MRALFAVLALTVVAVGTGCTPPGPSEIQVAVTDNGFVPYDITIKKGQAAVLVFTRKSENTCATEAIFAETGRKYDLPLNEPVRVDLTGVSPGTLHFSCGMAMEKGTVKIE